MPEITIFRGLPGSGKTTAARRLQALTGAVMLEPDMLCVRDGQYQYSERCYRSAIRGIQEMVGIAVYNNSDIILADVFPDFKTLYDFLSPYKRFLKCRSLILAEMPTLTLEQSLAANTHNVRREDIERMLSGYEPLDGVCGKLIPLFLNVKGVKLSDNADIEDYFGKHICRGEVISAERQALTDNGSFNVKLN